MKNFTIEKFFKYTGLLMMWGSIAAVAYVIMLGVETSSQGKWPTVEGQVLKAEFTQVVERLRDDPNAPNVKKEVYNWIPEFEYSYEVNGQKFTSRQISTFNPLCRTESDV
ncbi:MAG: hypothetical protein ACOYXC_05455, partial [Candidatus Rifleibacteriota bacterium]